MGAERQTIPIAEPARASVDIAGHRFVVTGWSAAQWDRTAKDQRPADAQRLGDLGWITVRLEGGSSSS